jgi:geranylgeranyl transferase type-2 subunit beta
MNAIYWGLTALCVMDHKDALAREDVIAFVMSCWDEEAGLFQQCCVRMDQPLESTS